MEQWRREQLILGALRGVPGVPGPDVDADLVDARLAQEIAAVAAGVPLDFLELIFRKWAEQVREAGRAEARFEAEWSLTGAGGWT